MYAITVITQWTIQNGVLTNRLNSFKNGTQYFLKKFGTEVLNIPNMGTKIVEKFWIIKGSKDNNVVLSIKSTSNTTFQYVVTEEIMSEGMGL